MKTRSTRTGTVEKRELADGGARWYARLRATDGTRPRVRIPDEFCYSAERREQFAQAVQERLDADPAALRRHVAPKVTPAPVGEASDADAWVSEWLASKVAKGQTSTRDNGAHWKLHIRDAVAGRHVRDWTSEDLRELVARLDEKIAAGTMSPKTAQNVWGTATRMCGAAYKSKVAALRCRQDDPSRDVEGPDRGVEKAKQWLYPSEFLALMACERVPLRWRRAIALSVYLYPRAGELRALRWEDVDLEHGTVHVHQSFERRTRTIKSTKAKRSRLLNLEPAVLELLVAMREENPDGRLVMPLPNRLADRLRDWLAMAGVTRRALFEASDTTKPIGWHDLRATGLTWLAVRGDDPAKIMQRAGHRDLGTTQKYVRTAEAVGVQAFGEVFPRLPGPLFRSTKAEATEKLNDFGAGHGIRTRDRVQNPRDSAHDVERSDSVGGDLIGAKSATTGDGGPRWTEVLSSLHAALAKAPPEAIATVAEAIRVVAEEAKAERHAAAGVVDLAAVRGAK